MDVALDVRVSTTRPQHPPTLAQPRIRLREQLATRPDGQLAADHLDRADGDRGATLHRPGLDRRRDRAALAAFDLGLRTAPDRLARHDVQPMRRLDALAQRGSEVECLDRPMRQEPPDQLLLPSRGAVAEDDRPLITDRRRRGRQAKWRRGPRRPWSVPPDGDVMDAERPREPQHLRLAPGKAAVIPPILAW
jgi:site-specific DNA recombinase